MNREVQTPEEREAEEHFARGEARIRPDYTLAWFVMVGLGAIAFIILFTFSGCASAPKPTVVDHVVTVTVKEKCAVAKTPEFVPVPPPSACRDGFMCYPNPDYANLVSNVEALKIWMGQILAECAK